MSTDEPMSGGESSAIMVEILTSNDSPTMSIKFTTAETILLYYRNKQQERPRVAVTPGGEHSTFNEEETMTNIQQKERCR